MIDKLPETGCQSVGEHRDKINEIIEAVNERSLGALKEIRDICVELLERPSGNYVEFGLTSEIGLRLRDAIKMSMESTK